MKEENYIIHNNGMYSEVKVEFGFCEFDENPDEVTDIIGLKPTEIIRKGEPSKFTPGRINQFNLWVMRATDNLSINMVDQIDILIEQIVPFKEKIIRYSQLSSPFLNIVIKSYGGDRPLIDYRKDVVKFLAEINAETGVDLYIFDNDGALPLKEIEIL